MGSPKALLSWHGETFADRLIRILGAVCDPVVLVLGYDADVILSSLERRSQALIAVNPHPERGQLSSLQRGLQALPAGYDAVMFTLVDHPALDEDTVRSLAAAIARYPLAIPRYQGRRGHPVCLRAALAGEILALPPEATAKDVIHAHLDAAAYIDVNHSGIADDIDDPATYQRLHHAADHR